MLKNRSTRVLFFTGLAALALLACWMFLYRPAKIHRIQLTSPHNLPLQEAVSVSLNKPAKIYVRYWKEGSSQVLTTPLTASAKEHTVQLLLLEPGSTYSYQVVVAGFPGKSTKTASFHTREQSSWMVHDWVQDKWPHDSTALGDGLALICYRKKPGYMAMVDGKGKIRWYWQDDSLGVVLANLTPRGTLVALLGPPQSGEAKDASDKTLQKLQNTPFPMRMGRRGFISGTHIVEIDLAGKELWRIDLEKQKIPRIIHHDLRMDSAGRIHAIYRDPLPYDFRKIGGTGPDTLWGDGVVVMDTTGRELRTWSGWDHWDIQKDTGILDFAYDRFHFNTVSFDGRGAYLLSSPILCQIWKVDMQTGKVAWKLGRNGDFAMDSSAYFYFQHAVHINPQGDLMLFDNGDVSPRDTSSTGKLSRALSFHLDTVAKKASLRMETVLPPSKYTSRMGAAYLLPNGNLLHTSSKKATALITDQKGNVLWEMRMDFLPYRAEYIPANVWNKWFRAE